MLVLPWTFDDVAAVLAPLRTDNLGSLSSFCYGRAGMHDRQETPGVSQ